MAEAAIVGAAAAPSAETVVMEAVPAAAVATAAEVAD